MGEFRVHRVKFCTYTPKAIHCLSYEESIGKLAVSRSDGSIEIWNLHHNWLQEMVIPPSEIRSVEALKWSNGRLFSAGLDGNLHEYDLLTRKVKHTVSSNSGPIWCLALKEDGSQIAAGTEDGCVVIFSITDYGVDFSRTFSKVEGRILSVAYNSDMDVIVTGGVDNIRVWSLVSSQAIQRLTLPKVDKSTETIVWALAVTKDFTIISGDSSGKISFWNGRQGTLIKSFKSHKADVLCLCVNKAGTSVFCAGVDPNVVQFDYVAANKDSDWKMWVKLSVRSQHTHDVRALTFAKNGVISAGVDAHMIYNDLEGQGGVMPWKRIPSIPHAPFVYTAKAAHMVMFKYSDSLEVWKLGRTNETSSRNNEVLSLDEKPLKLLQLKARDGEYIVSAAVSADGQWIVYSTQTGIRLFQIEKEEGDFDAPHVTVNKVRYIPADIQPAHLMQLTPDGRKIVTVTLEGHLQVIKVNAVHPELINTIKLPRHGEKNAAIHLLAICPRGKYIATGDLNGCVHIFLLKKGKHVCTVPDLPHIPAAMCFHPVLPHLAVAYTNQMIVEFSIHEKTFTEWTLKHMYKFPQAWQKSLHKIHKISYNPLNLNQILVHSTRNFTLLDKTEQSFPGQIAFHTCSNFQYLLHTDFLSDDFMIIVERPPLAMNESLPAALKQKKFGT